EDICAGKGREEDIELLLELAETVREASLCGLGKTAPNPVITTIKYFKDEYLAHIKGKRCPAGVCKELTSYRINQELCRRCGVCVKKCPAGAIFSKPKSPYVIDNDKCIVCGACREACRFNAVEILGRREG
ncbi:NADH-ubiquinone oxidoreductase-F iron-sulfur binding region domain-containing protein, partial [Thermovenabulum sp.]